jgi:hypothetical protein
MDKWDGKTVEIQRIFDNNPIWLNAHKTVPRAVFTLKRNDHIPGDGQSRYPRYELTFKDGDMIEFWRGLWLVEVPGIVPPAVHGLPEWQADGSSEGAWSKVLDPISAGIRTIGSNYTYLQGFMPVITDLGDTIVDRVRMAYLDQAITKSNGSTLDLVLVVLTAQGSGGLQEDGAGGGPPK